MHGEIGMRYKKLLFVAILLLATPLMVYSQESSPIIVKTGKPTPSVVRSGEPFFITYQVEFLDEVFVYEEQMQPSNLPLENIEVLGLKVHKERTSNDTL